MKAGWRKRLLGSVSTMAIIGGTLVALPAMANADVDAGSNLVINEIYGGGGNASASYSHDFVELYNKSAADIVLTGKSVQYASSAGTNWGGVVALSGTIKANDYFLIKLASGGSVGAALPGFNQEASAPNLSATSGNVALVEGTAALTCQTTGCAGDDAVIDLVGFGSGAAFAGAAAPSGSNANSISRNASHANTANNAADFTAGAPSPTVGTTPPPPDPVEKTIAEVQGTGATSPLVGVDVITRGVVTAVYAVGGFNGFSMQTPGTGGARDYGTQLASDGIWVFQGSAPSVSIGDYVEVTGTVVEFSNLTEIDTTAADIVVLSDPFTPPTPITNDTLPASARESVESMLFDPTGLDFTVTNTFNTNTFGEVGLAFGNSVLMQSTDVAKPGTPQALAVNAFNADNGIAFDDGRSTNFGSWANNALIPPFISLTSPFRVGASASLLQPVVIDYRNNAWKLQPTTPFDSTNASAWMTYTSDRPATVDDLGAADLSVASFNVLNYFTTLGAVTSGCTGFPNGATGDGTATDPRTNVNSCPGSGPRGAWDVGDLARQQAKIVAAINSLDADVVGLMEIENSAVVDGTPDEAVGTLVNALNAAAGTTKWAFVPSSAQLPAVGSMDVITNAIIYQVASVTRLGDSQALGTLSGSGQAFNNAREPIAQAFTPVGGGEPFLFVVNHFKSKGSGSGPDADQGDGQGASNLSRVNQATALRDWIPTALAEHGSAVSDVFLVGDFNAYTQEDPMWVLYNAGYIDVNDAVGANTKQSYNFSGLNGSLDHVVANASAAARITGSDIWNINSPESVAMEYSRFGYHGQNFYDDSAFRASDHDPVVVGITADVDVPATVNINLLAINDFHGRIDTNTLKWAGTIEGLRQAAGAASTLLIGAGDLVSASLFASAVQDDQPTIDVMNEIGLDASAVGNHEFDKGWEDLRDRIIGDTSPNAMWDYLGANVYAKGTENAVLPEYVIFTVNGIKVGVTGAVTDNTPSLVSPAGIADLDFGDPVAAVNRVAAQLSDGNEANGEADIVVATFHEGAPDGTKTLANQVAASSIFADIVNGLTADVDVIFNGHTHQKYAYDGPIPGSVDGTRPILQTGQYGENIGQVVLTVDTATKGITDYTMANVARVTTADSTLLTTYPQLQPIQDTVTAALAYAASVGNEKKGEVTADITSAYSGGSYTGGVYTGGARDDRSKESALGNLLADSLLATLSAPELGGAEIGIMNPGGIRAELFDTQAEFGASAVLDLEDGDISYSQANAVLPFVNNLWTTTLTGAQFKSVLEQQWQRDSAGNPVPSRPYQQLGLSANVTYTYDASRAEGDRITSITIDGEPYSPTADYRIGTFSFLIAGGDNFHAFKDGTNATDTGLIDRDAWIAYLEQESPLSPNFAKHAVSVTGFNPNPTWTEGDAVSFDVSGVNLTSRGAQENTTITAKIGATTVGTYTVTAGAATIAFTVPAGIADGENTLTLTAAPTNTIVRIPFTGVPTTTSINLLGINDFHGRIDGNTLKWAGTIEGLRQAAGETSTLLIGAGDLVGASLFASAVADDQPTIDVMNEIGLDASAVGNHEFDKGWEDLRDRIIGDTTPNALWDYLGANVYAKGTENPVLPEYVIFTVNGIRIGVTGAVTEETPTLVSPAGIADLDFGDPVAAVNRVAAQLSDGNEANGEADIVVATFHEGAPDGAQSLADQMTASATFASIVNLSADVDVIFNGHTHQKYAYDGPIPGSTDGTRPILQTGQYGENIGQVVLTVDLATKGITDYTMANVARVSTADSTLLTNFPQLQPVQDTVTAALANAATVGNVPKGSVTLDITTAYSGGSYTSGTYQGGSRDARGLESTLGNLVADSLRDTLSAPELGGADIGVVNPGGLRAELFDTQAEFGGSAVAGLADGEISYSQANGVLPFVNNLWTTTLTGAQFKTLLEQQWQQTPTGDPIGGTRPYLQLGLSENVTYTFDASRALNDRITSITINDAAYNPAADYRIGTFSFLATGGDNFHIFKDSTNVTDTGLVDRDAWIAYIEENSPLSPSFVKHAVSVTGINPNPTFTGGTAVTFTVGNLDLTSRSAPQNTTINASIGATDLGDFDVTNGTATVAFTVPADMTNGANTLTLTATPSGTVVTIPFTGAELIPASSSVEILSPSGRVASTPDVDEVTVKVTTDSDDASGTVTIVDASNTVLGTGTVDASGNGVVTLTSPLDNGDYMLRAKYAGNTTTEPSDSTGVLVQVSFADILSSQFFDAIQWMTTSGITTGYPDGLFKPGQNVSRQAIAAWLYRYAHNGADAPACTAKPAVDVPIGSPFCGAIKWMYDEGLTTGYNEGGKNYYKPADSLQRKQVVTFLYRLDGGTGTTCTGAAPFPDVPVNNPFCAAIKWASTNNVVNGYLDGQFKPNNMASRQAVASFLYKYDQL